MAKQKRDVTQDQIILTGQFLRLAQRMGRTDLTAAQNAAAVRTALNQLKSAVKVAQTAYDLLLTASAQEHALPVFGIPMAQHNGAQHNGAQHNGTMQGQQNERRSSSGRPPIANDVREF